MSDEDVIRSCFPSALRREYRAAPVRIGVLFKDRGGTVEFRLQRGFRDGAPVYRIIGRYNDVEVARVLTDAEAASVLSG